MKNAFLFITVAIFLGCVENPKVNPDLKVDVGPTDKKVMAQICLERKNEAEILKGLNLETVEKETTARISSLSGDIENLKAVTKIENAQTHFRGLIYSPCFEAIYDLTLGCDGKVQLSKDGQIVSQSLDEILRLHPLNLKKATLCGTLALKKDSVLFINASEVVLNNFSIKIEENALLSVSASNLVNSNELRDVQVDPKGTISMHILKDSTK